MKLTTWVYSLTALLHLHPVLIMFYAKLILEPVVCFDQENVLLLVKLASQITLPFLDYADVVCQNASKTSLA